MQTPASLGPDEEVGDREVPDRPSPQDSSGHQTEVKAPVSNLGRRGSYLTLSGWQVVAWWWRQLPALKMVFTSSYCSAARKIQCYDLLQAGAGAGHLHTQTTHGLCCPCSFAQLCQGLQGCPFRHWGPMLPSHTCHSHPEHHSAPQLPASWSP